MTFLKDMKKLLFLASITFIGSCTLNAQATLIEKVEAQKGSLAVPYEKYVLPNGLTVIINEDHSKFFKHIRKIYKYLAQMDKHNNSDPKFS